MKTRTLLLLLSMSVVACSSSVADDGSGGGGGDDGGATGGGGGAAAEGEALDLFACGIVPDCVQDSGHLGEGLTEEAIRCGGELAVSPEPGALQTTSQPGPYPTSVETLIVLDGTGILHRQTRHSCTDEACAEQRTTGWVRSALERCTVDAPAEDVEGCDTEDGACAWYGSGKDCVAVAETWTCDDLSP